MKTEASTSERKTEEKKTNAETVENYLFSPLELAEHALETLVHIIELKNKVYALISQSQVTSPHSTKPPNLGNYPILLLSAPQHSFCLFFGSF